MKCWLLTIASVFFYSAFAAVSIPDLPLVCDRRYASDTKDILAQAAGFANEKTLKEYRDYMILLKQFEDLSLKVHQFESTIATLTTPTLALLRDPATKYNDCRTQRILNPAVTPTTCDITYAYYMNRSLKKLEPAHGSKEIESYIEYFKLLKHLEDTRFQIHKIDAGSTLKYISTMRAAITRYLGCRDEIIRNFKEHQIPIKG